MNLNLDLIVDLYKKTSYILALLTIISLFSLLFFFSFFKSFSFALGCFIIYLNVLGIFLIAKFSEKQSKINKDRIIFSMVLFIGKMFLIIAIIFILLKFHFVNVKMFIGGLSLGFLIFLLANIIFLPLKIYKQEKAIN